MPTSTPTAAQYWTPTSRRGAGRGAGRGASKGASKGASTGASTGASKGVVSSRRGRRGLAFASSCKC